MSSLQQPSHDDLAIAREIAVALEDQSARFFAKAHRSGQDRLILGGQCDDHWIIQAIAVGVAMGRTLKQSA